MSYSGIDPTCKLTAALRARESLRPDRLYVDPYAAELTDAEGREFLADVEALEPDPGTKPCTVNYNAIRTRFFDDLLLSLVREGGVRQVVLAAAGLDTRAHRLAWPEGVTLFEMDRGSALEHKRATLRGLGAQPRCDWRLVNADLTGEWLVSLQRAGFDSGRRSVWLLEGLLYYLSERDVSGLLEQIRKATTAGDWLCADLVNQTALQKDHPIAGRLWSIYERRGVGFRSGHDEPEALWAEHGFQAQVLQPGDSGASYERWSVPMPSRKVPNIPRAFLVTGQRQAD